MPFDYTNMTFVHTWVLWLIPVFFIVQTAWLFWIKGKTNPSIVFSDASPLLRFQNPIISKIKSMIELLPFIITPLLLIAIARPQSSHNESKVTTQGIDIVLSVDVSSSMLARDFKPNRLDAAKQTAIEFIDGRPNDRIGLVVFSGESFTQCPITIDHNVLKNQLKQIRNGLLEDGTAIGMGLATAVHRLKDSKAKSKVVILMTDGVNNRGSIDPIMASDIAMQFDSRVYTIGVGSQGKAYTPVAMDASGNLIFDYAEVQIDEKLLTDIAKKTGGQYFRATNNKKLSDIFKEIDKLEKTKIDVAAYSRKTELFYQFAFAAFFLMVIYWLGRYTFFRTIT